MAMKYLGEQFDIHTGGIDHIPVHHTNEIAQAEAASGKHPFVKYWVHHNHLHVDGIKMSKSLGNFLTIDDVVARGFHPRALRLLFLTTYYRDEQNFTWESLASAQSAYQRLAATMASLKAEKQRTTLSEEKLEKVNEYREKFNSALANDLHTAEAVTVMYEVIKSNIPSPDKYDLLIDFDEALGLGLRQGGELKVSVPTVAQEKVGSDTLQISLHPAEWLSAHDESITAEVRQLLADRQLARDAKDWIKSDTLRDQIKALGYEINDGEEQTVKLIV